MNSIDLQPRLTGRTITLRPLIKGDFAELRRAACDPRIWEQHPDSSRYRKDVFEERFFAGAIESGGALTVLRNESGRIIGCSRYYDWDPELKHIAVGFTFLTPDFWGDGTNREMKALMLSHIFGYVDSVWFHVGEKNLRSRRAVEKLGATLSHREDKELGGDPYVQLFYRLNASAYAGRQDTAS